jgi:hypothetical protein
MDGIREIHGDIWDYYKKSGYRIIIPTNGCVRNNGKLVMGRGIAKEAVENIPGIEIALGNLVGAYGNIPYFIKGIISFPVKENWSDKADLRLIKNSMKLLTQQLREEKWRGIKKIIFPRVGCGNGKLKWKEVWTVIEPYMTNQFILIRR